MLSYNAKFEELNTLISDWKWSELKYGLCREYISMKDVISYANEILSNDVPYMEIIIQLLIADDEEVDDILEKLVSCEESPSEDNIKSKWIFAFIYHAFTYSKDKIFDIIEDVYEEFDYTEEISNLVPYMPCEDGLPLEDRLKRYIEQNRNIWC